MEDFIGILAKGMAEGAWIVQYLVLIAAIAFGAILLVAIVTGIVGAVKRKSKNQKELSA